MPNSDAIRVALRAQRSRITARYANEFEECLCFAREAMPHYSGDSHFDSVIHALWFDLRGEVPDEWWDESILEAAYQNFVGINQFWLDACSNPTAPDPQLIEELARLLVQTYRGLNPAALEKSDVAS